MRLLNRIKQALTPGSNAKDVANKVPADTNLIKKQELRGLDFSSTDKEAFKVIENYKDFITTENLQTEHNKRASINVSETEIDFITLGLIKAELSRKNIYLDIIGKGIDQQEVEKLTEENFNELFEKQKNFTIDPKKKKKHTSIGVSANKKSFSIGQTTGDSLFDYKIASYSELKENYKNLEYSNALESGYNYTNKIIHKKFDTIQTNNSTEENIKNLKTLGILLANIHTNHNANVRRD